MGIKTLMQRYLCISVLMGIKTSAPAEIYYHKGNEQ